ncbi:hypothetical protein WMY93_033428 [Mugilogobius chulae]|uniref:CCHC-type domain-containing protein n=1 Tax=Mugilogobius chulae TaxID=88201 RepID=A0AAW0MIR9_9GOBI
MAAPSAEGSPPLSMRHGVRVVADPRFSVEQVLLALGEKVGHANIVYGSRMNKAVVVFFNEVRLVHDTVESGLVLGNEFVTVSPLFVPSVRVTVSGVPPFISNESIERELVRFGKLASGLKPVRLGCKDARLQHVQSLRRQCFMYLNDPNGTLEVSFSLKHENRHYTLYVNSGSLKCFECGDVGHKRAACPHREPRAGEEERGEGSGEARVEEPVQVQEEGGARPDHSGDSEIDTEAGEPAEPQNSAVSVTTEHVQQVEVQADESAERSIPGSEGEGEETPGCISAGEGSSVACQEQGEDNEMETEEDETLSQISDVSQDETSLYSVEEINQFLDSTYGNKVANIEDFFSDVDGFISSVRKIRKQVGTDKLSQKKRYRLSKLVGKLKKEGKEKSGVKK